MRIWLVVVLMIFVGTGCNGEHSQIEEVRQAANNTERSGWVLPYDKAARKPAAIVFVHGIFGTTRGTWTAADGKTFFNLIRQYPEVGDKVDIYAFGYTSEMFKGGSFTIQEAAKKFSLFMEEEGVWEYDTVVLVGHSMGGLVIMTALSVQPEWTERVPLVVMYGTPQEGSQLASIGKQILKNPALKQMVPRNANEFINSLDYAWTNLPKNKRPELVCAYEKTTVYGFEVVSQSSGTRYCTGVSHGMEQRNHITITKPTHVDDYPVRLLGNKLKVVLGTDRKARIETLDFTPEGDRLVFKMRDPIKLRNTARLFNPGALRARVVVGKPSSDKLLITPVDDPMFVDGGDTEELVLELLVRGEWVDKVEFELDTPGRPDRIVQVQIPSPPALEQRAAFIQTEILSDLDKALALPDIKARVLAIPEEYQPLFVVELAERTLKRLDVGATQASRWVYVAEAMTNQSWSTYADRALLKAKQESPDLVRSSAVRSLSEAVAAKAGTESVFVLTDGPGPRPSPIKYDLQDSWPTRDVRVADTANLTRNMQSIPGLKRAGLTLEGNILLNAGQRENAERIYRSVLDLRVTPEAEVKWRVARGQLEKEG